MTFPGKETLKELLGEIPFTAELYWLLRQRGRPISRFSLRRLEEAMPRLVAEAQAARPSDGQPGAKQVLIFASLHYWIEHAAVLGLALAGMGHQVTLGYLPYGEWHKPMNRFDVRRQNAYARRILKQAEPLMQVVSFLERPTAPPLPEELRAAVDKVTAYDYQYTLQVEDVEPGNEVYKLRAERNEEAARMAWTWMRLHRPDVVIVPNGTIQEMGVVYRVARHLKVPVVTYEFGDQRERIWLAHNSEVMRQETDALWQARRGTLLTEAELERLRSLFAARQHGKLYENFSRLWQGSPTQGEQQVRTQLKLDERPIALLATNVLGDSLTLGRQVFSQSMAEWIARTVQYFAGCPQVQLVVRVHPGETLTHGPSMVDVVRQVLPRLPENIRLVGPKDNVNTYDLVDAADFGLVYTTTVGMEMAMSGLPVVVAGQTHYRGRGFTIDPDSWVSYFKALGQLIANPAGSRLPREQVELAWQYAYRFFFEYPRPFPWHIVRLWEDLELHPMREVLSPAGQAAYRPTFNLLTGGPIQWPALLAGEAAEHA